MTLTPCWQVRPAVVPRDPVGVAAVRGIRAVPGGAGVPVLRGGGPEPPPAGQARGQGAVPRPQPRGPRRPRQAHAAPRQEAGAGGARLWTNGQ